MKAHLHLLRISLILLGFTAANAQSTSDVSKTAAAVKVVDNKGTIKYFQSNNGITQIVNTTANQTTTTWQLGGTLTDDTILMLAVKLLLLMVLLWLHLPMLQLMLQQVVVMEQGRDGHS